MVTLRGADKVNKNWLMSLQYLASCEKIDYMHLFANLSQNSVHMYTVPSVIDISHYVIESNMHIKRGTFLIPWAVQQKNNSNQDIIEIQ